VTLRMRLWRQAFDKLVASLAKWDPRCIYLDLDGTSNPVLMDEELDGARRLSTINSGFVAPKEAIVAILDATQDLKPSQCSTLLIALHRKAASRKGGVDIPKPPKTKHHSRGTARKPLGILSDGNTPMRTTGGGSKWRGSSPLMASNMASSTPQGRSSLQFKSFHGSFCTSFVGSVPALQCHAGSFIGSLPPANADYCATDPEAFWSE